ncbi:hypothetical protein B0H11DRAFT_2104432 [Mycena galericulata]|nr:hypothetical protein B0H11DRAFT_2104432 [Mycena galericulata]
MSHSGPRENFYTESSVPSTVWGPGTLAGRAILALGEATLKGLDRIIDRESRAIEKRLHAIYSLAPHLTTDMYDDLIELSSPDVYPQDVMERASDLLVHQLNLGYGAAVASSLIKLPLSEARLVMFRLSTSRNFEIPDYYNVVSIPPQFPALDLLAMLVQVLPDMTSICCELLDHLFRNPHVFMRLHRFRTHPILRVHAEEGLNIPEICRTPLSELQIRFSRDRMHRWKSWRALEGTAITAESRLIEISGVLLHASEDSYSTPEFFDSAVDLFDFLRYSQDPEIRRTATDHLIQCLSDIRNSWGTLSDVLNFGWEITKGENPRFGLYTVHRASNAVWGREPELASELHPLLAKFLDFACLRSVKLPNNSQATAASGISETISQVPLPGVLKTLQQKPPALLNETMQPVPKTPTDTINMPLDTIPEAEEDSLVDIPVDSLPKIPPMVSVTRIPMANVTNSEANKHRPYAESAGRIRPF